MSTCANHLNDGPLECQRTDDHAAGRGCVYEAREGPDRHDLTEGVDE